MLEAAASDLVTIAVTGSDRASHLDAVTTQRFVDVPVGTVLGVLALSAKGVPQAMAWALVDTDRILLLAPPGAAEHVLDELAARTFLADVAFTRLDHGPVTALGASDPADLADLDDVGPVDTWRTVDTGDGTVWVVHHAFGVELVGTAEPDVVTATADVARVDLDELRIRRGEPRWGHEVVAGRLPEEYGLLATHVHLSKGCYPGQEPIAHMWMLGRPRRRLARLHGAVGDARPDDVLTGVAGDRALGFVAPDVAVGDGVGGDPGDGLAVAAFVGDERDVVGWTPAQTRRRDREAGADRPGRRP